ncbi:uncharacterized protein BJX67DRAFT_383864 [Aspergillus lucknowensis]|uniref:Cyanovirin-N n=1 Tax=Aspergillus lucknowensis TaxID=176173 RepID=A0ABR4LIL1_9EURO
MSRSLTLLGLTALVAAQGYSSECSDITLNNSWLVATCPTGNGDEITSSVFLANKIGNNGGNLEWAANGEYRETCEECVLNDAATLFCRCRVADRPSLQDTTINLEEHIANYEGHLLSDQAGPVTTIPKNSDVAVPSDFGVEILLNGPSSSCATFGVTLGLNDPTDCFYLDLGGDISYPTASSANNQGWEIAGYTDADCATEPAITFTQGNVGECYTELSPGLKAFSVKPLWNADY